MFEKIDLSLILKEIKEDEDFDSKKKQKASQDDIKRMITERQKGRMNKSD